MMKIQWEHQGTRYHSDLSAGTSIAIPLQFSGPQPNHFGTAEASEDTLILGDFVGDTRRGGSCNVDELQLIPHCNGTHTETVAHIVNDDIWVGHAADDILCLAALASVPMTMANESDESYRPALDESDLVITAGSLKRAFGQYLSLRPRALVIRTISNDVAKMSRKYASGAEPAFLTVEAMQFLVEVGICHLLVDLPSVDRMYDEGLLTNHHLFWNVPEGTHELTQDSWQNKTITEMVYVPDDVADGAYLLSLQLPSFATDAAPSRPFLIPFAESE